MEYDILSEPPREVWDQICQKTQEMSHLIPIVRHHKSHWWRYVAAALFTAGILFLGLTVLPSTSEKVPAENSHDSSLFWTFFKSDMWDVGGFFRRVNEQKLAQMTPHIEKEFRLRLERELGLNEEDAFKLFPLLSRFGEKSKEYYYRYCDLMASLSCAVQKDEADRLAGYLSELQQIRRNWFESQWQFLTDVQTVLNQQKYARFLLFTERVPQELYTIYAHVCSEQG